ncbi:hypothetical protein N8269_02230 [Candidatus Thioglobus sp.]|nr:hypothetical protein [Candidatus Thioglobus sp.]
MKKSAKNRTEYQEFLYSLMEDYGIDKPKASWSNSEWKEVVNYRLNNADIKSFHEQLTAFNIKTPTNEIWTHVSDDEEEERIADAKRAEEKRIADAKKVEEENALLIKELEKEKEEERIADAKKVEEEKSILYALKVEEDKVPKKEEFHTENIKYGELKKCPYCAEDINIAAIKCKHCGEIFDKEKISRNTYDVASATLIKDQSSLKDQRHTNTVVVRENNNGCLTILLIFICCFLIGYFILGPLAIFGLIIAFLNSF